MNYFFGKRIAKKLLLQQCIDERLHNLKKNKYEDLKKHLNKQWFEEAEKDGVKIRLEIEIGLDYCIEDSRDIRINVIADDYSLLSFVRSVKGSFSITPQNEILD